MTLVNTFLLYSTSLILGYLLGFYVLGPLLAGGF